MVDSAVLLKTLENASIGTWSWNMTKGEVRLSRFVRAMFGFPPERGAYQKDDIISAVVDEDRQQLDQKLGACRVEGDCFKAEFRILSRDGQLRWLQCRGCVSDAGRHKPLIMTGVMFDISERKRIECRLFDSEELFRITAQSANDGIVIIDQQGVIVFWNHSAERIFGHSRAEAEGKMLDALVVPHRHTIVFKNTLDRFRRSGEAAAPSDDLVNVTIEQAIMHKNGREKPVEISISSMLKKGERYCLWIVRDISERKAMERALLAEKDKADAANKAKSAFLSHMSHEIRTPLNAIMGFSQLLGIDAGMTEEQKDYLDEIIKAGDHLNGLIGDVLDMARIEAGRISLDIVEIPLAGIFSEAVSLVSQMAEAVGIQIENRLPEAGTAAVMADSLRLKQIMLNLLTNAIKYNRPQGRVVLAHEQHAAAVRIIVTDTGHGLTEEHCRQLFRPFERLDAEHTNLQGTGLGLVITKLLVEHLGGTIGVQSEPGVGTSFWIELPAAPVRDTFADDRLLACVEN